VEVKALGIEVSGRQEMEINKLTRTGFNACGVSGIDGVKEFLSKEFGINFK